MVVQVEQSNLSRFSLKGYGNQYLNQTTLQLFIKEYNHTQSSRALGWNTNDPTVEDMGMLMLRNLNVQKYNDDDE
jgi:hypothetical protein